VSPTPREHDLADLRRLAREGPTGTGGAPATGAGLDLDPGGSQAVSPGGAGDRSAFRAGLYRELLPLEASAAAEKPYLRQLPEAVAAEYLLFEWIEHLLGGGVREATEALDYYESIGWIGPAVRRDLDDYLRGVEAGDGDGRLAVDDHMLSLVYVAKLSSRVATRGVGGDETTSD